MGFVVSLEFKFYLHLKAQIMCPNMNPNMYPNNVILGHQMCIIPNEQSVQLKAGSKSRLLLTDSCVKMSRFPPEKASLKPGAVCETNCLLHGNSFHINPLFKL